MKLRLLKPRPYLGKVGAIIAMNASSAKVLLALDIAEMVVDEVREVKRRRTYKRRDMVAEETAVIEAEPPVEPGQEEDPFVITDSYDEPESD